jgi:hypothetical protein
MDSIILKKKLDGFRTANGSIRDVSPEVLWELRQAWESFTGPIEQFRSDLGIHTGTLRNLLSSAKKLNHVMASADSVALHDQVGESVSSGAPKPEGSRLELVYDQGEKVIRFPDVDTLIDFLKRAV